MPEQVAHEMSEIEALVHQLILEEFKKSKMGDEQREMCADFFAEMVDMVFRGEGIVTKRDPVVKVLGDDGTLLEGRLHLSTVYEVRRQGAPAIKKSDLDSLMKGD